MKKRILAMLLILSTLSTILNFNIVVHAVTINDSSIFVKHPSDGDSTCVFTSCLNMFRRRAIIDGRTDWSEITHANYKNAITTNGYSVRASISDVKGMNASRVYIGDKTTSEKKSYFISMLQQHPEGFAIYCGSNPMHTVLLTDYTSGTFYCVETLSSYPAGRIPLTSTWLGKGLTQDSAIAKISYIWHITNKSGYSYADFGTGFYGVILNEDCWKPITCEDDGYVRLRTENGRSNQVWYFEKHSDGSYAITSAANGKALEMYNGIREDGTPLRVHGTYWDGAYQKWYFYPQGEGYIIKSKHFQEENKVMDLYGNYTADGTTININTQNNGKAQIWKIYKEDDVQLKAPTLSVTAGKSATNTKFSWTQVYGETYYILNIKKNGSVYKNIEGIYDTSYPVNLPSGSYTATVQAANYYHGKTSTSVSFTVTDSTYAVTLNNQSATTAGSTSVTATYGSAMPSITVPKKTGYTFGGYYDGTNGSGTQYYKADGTSARTWDKTSATTLYAKWTANKYTVTLNNQSATTAGTTSVSATYGSAMPSITVPKKTGYTFGGYYTGTNGSGTQYYTASGASARSWDKTSATTLYAKWTANTYKVTFNANGGTTPTASKKCYL